MTEEQEQKLWTTTDLARAAGINPSLVRRALESGKLQGTKVHSRTWLVRDSEARRWLETRRVRQRKLPTMRKARKG